MNTKIQKEPLVYSLYCEININSSSALSPKNVSRNCLPKNQYIEKWVPIRLELAKPYFEDYLGNDIGFRLFSERFRDFIEQHKQPKDRFQWLENHVFCGDEERPYFVLHFYDADDVLDISRVIWHPRPPKRIIKPVFSARKILGHSIFTYDDPGYICNSDTPFVTKELMYAILEAKMTGVTFEAKAVTDDLAEK